MSAYIAVVSLYNYRLKYNLLKYVTKDGLLTVFCSDAEHFETREDARNAACKAAAWQVDYSIYRSAIPKTYGIIGTAGTSTDGPSDAARNPRMARKEHAMNKKRYIAAIITEEDGTLYLTSWGSTISFLVKDKTRAFRYINADAAKSACRAGKKHAEKQGRTVVSTAVLEDHEPDAVHSPAHYQLADGVEAIDVIDQAVDDPASFYRGNAINYLLRAGRKGDAKQDLEKARWYIDRELGNE